MLNKLLAFVRRYDMIQPGDTVICAVSGGADSVALLFAMYLLKDKLKIDLAAAHFNHGLRGEESDADEAFVRGLCDRYDIPLYVGSSTVKAGDKGLEAAAREARYRFFSTLEGKIATAHTANDNAETVLLHLVRGTGLKGLGAIAPVRGNVIRPMLMHTRKDVLDFLEAYSLPHVQDSSNATDQFLRNRIRRHVVPLLEQENPCLAENLSAMALRLREDEAVLADMSAVDMPPGVDTLRRMPAALRSRALAAFLQQSGVKEPEASHITLVEQVVCSDKPSASADLPGGITVQRQYDKLTVISAKEQLETLCLSCPGAVDIPQMHLQVICEPAAGEQLTADAFTVCPVGEIYIRCRQPGDKIRLKGGTKDLKKLFIDRKIPVSQRMLIPVIADDAGVLGVYGFGANLNRTGPGVCIRFVKKPQP